ncbi:ankyrin-2b isoform 2-T2 [Clarias gariepinus]
MKQDLIKMTAILTTDSSEKSNSMHGGSLEKGVEEMSGEPFEIMEKVKEDLEKVNKILRSGTYEDKADKESAEAKSRPYRKDEEWVLLSDCEIEEAKMMAAFETQEALLKDTRGSRGSQTQKGDHKEYMLDAPVTSGAVVKENVVQEKFTEVVLRKGGKKIIPSVIKDTKIPMAEVKKPIRRKGPHGQSDECNVSPLKTGSVSEKPEKTHQDDGLLHAPSSQKSPVSPVVEETPIGSIKDKVKALQKKVEEEQKGHKQTSSKSSPGFSGKKSSPVVKEQKTATTKKSSPVKSQKNESERLEETMSVKELMRAFQTGQDPSKAKSGLFEHKTSSVPKHTKSGQIKETLSTQSQSQTLTLGQKVSLEAIKCVDSQKTKEHQISTEIQHSHDLSSNIKAKPEDSIECEGPKILKAQDETTTALQSTDPTVQSNLATPVTKDLSMDTRDSQPNSGPDALKEISDSHKVEDLAVSPCASIGEGEVHMSSEDSDKHEGMAETLDTSPESLSSSPKRPGQCIDEKISKVETVTAKQDTSTLSISIAAKTTDSQISSTTFGCLSVKNAMDYPSKSESVSASPGKTVTFVDEKFSVDEDIMLKSSKPPKSRKLTKRGSETIDSFLSDEEPSDGQQLSTSADQQATRADTQGYSGLVLPLRHRSETNSPGADDSTTVSHKDSLEGSPLMEDNSSHKSPDSIEPSPTKDSPCCDSLESSPVAQKSIMAFPPTVEQPSVTSGHPTSSTAPELPPENLHKLPRDQEGSVGDDNFEQTSQLMSSGVHEIPQTSEDMAHTAASTDESAMEGPQSVSEIHSAKVHQISLQTELQSLSLKELEQNNRQLLSNETMFSVASEIKDASQIKSMESKNDDKGGKQKITTECQGVYNKSQNQIEHNVTDDDKGDQMRPAETADLGLNRDGIKEKTDLLPSIIGQVGETFKPEICIYEDTEDDLEKELPKTKSRGVTAKTLADNWNTMREDDEAFAARVKEEEQKILGLAVDRQSQGATPDTTPGRTPTEEGTPTSEQNPFLFQEGKLFEMTRSGAIDMTKRGYEEEGFAYFQIGEQPIEEALIEDEPGAEVTRAEREVAINLTEQIKPEDAEMPLKEANDISLHSTPEDDQSCITSKSDALQSAIPNKLAISASPKTSKNNIAKEAVEIKSHTSAEGSPSGTDLGSSDIIITDVLTAVSTVTRPVYSQQDQESSDSSPEEEHSVIEVPKAPEKKSQTSKVISKSKTKPGSKGNSVSTQKKASISKEEEKPKSRIPIKSISHDLPVKSPKEKKSKLPVKPVTRRKSETDTGPSVGSRVTRSIKAKSFCESDSTKKPTKKDHGHPAGTELPSKYKTLPSKLPVRGKPGQPTHTTTPGKKDQPSDSRKKSIDFFEEISDEAAKLVERLAQAEKEKEEAAAMSDDESSTIDVSVIESEPYPDMQMPLPEDPLVIRPRWDDPVETQMERIPADKAQAQSQADPQDELDRKEGRLAVMADHLGFSWTELARELEIDEEQVNQIRVENPNSLQDQSHALIRLWTKREGTNATESILILKLTKINRMDIVHLIKAKIVQSTQDHSSHTYAEMEQSISLDHSDGFSALQEDIDSPRPVRHTELTTRMPKSGSQPPLVSVEDLSSSVSSLDTQKEKSQLHIDQDEEVAEGSTLSGFDMIGLRQQFPGTIKRGDELPDITPHSVTEEQYTDEHGNLVTKKITRKIIRKYVSADGVEREEVMVEGAQQEAIALDDADGFSKVVKRTVVRSAGDQTEVTFSEPVPVCVTTTASEFEGETAQGRKVSKVIKTTVVQGERTEKLIGDPSLSADLPSAKEDFEKALSYAGSLDKVLLPHLVEKEIVKEDGSMVRRTHMRKTRTQKKTVVRDGQSKHIHLEQVEDTPESLQPDDLQQHLHQLLQRYCTPEVEEEKEEGEEARKEEQDTND